MIVLTIPSVGQMELSYIGFFYAGAAKWAWDVSDMLWSALDEQMGAW